MLADVMDVRREGDRLIASRPGTPEKPEPRVDLRRGKPGRSHDPAERVRQKRLDAGVAQVDPLGCPRSRARARSCESETPESKELDVSEADIIVSGGRGIKGPENWPVIRDCRRRSAPPGRFAGCRRRGMDRPSAPGRADRKGRLPDALRRVRDLERSSTWRGWERQGHRRDQQGSGSAISRWGPLRNRRRHIPDRAGGAKRFGRQGGVVACRGDRSYGPAPPQFRGSFENVQNGVTYGHDTRQHDTGKGGAHRRHTSGVYQGERILLERHGKDVVAMVSVQDWSCWRAQRTEWISRSSERSGAGQPFPGRRLKEARLERGYRIEFLSRARFDELESSHRRQAADRPPYLHTLEQDPRARDQAARQGNLQAEGGRTIASYTKSGRGSLVLVIRIGIEATFIARLAGYRQAQVSYTRALLALEFSVRRCDQRARPS